uniref:cdc42 effector protein 2-like n=1 Tax=Pristiophorus japonicus TaxID=55135 RepID=UPI00398E7CDD
MSAKAPIYLKRASRKGKKEKLRDILSSDMISSPLGDFRHTIHIGSGGEGDVFGDISFLKGQFHLLPGVQGGTLSQRAGRYLSYQFTRTGSLHSEQPPPPPPPDSPSPLLKNAISLPVIGGPRTPALPAEAPPKPPRLHLGEAPAREPVSVRGQEPEPPDLAAPPDQGSNHLVRPKLTLVRPEKHLLSHAVSLLSLHLDLGPSILDDVLQIMDKEQDVPVPPGVGALVHESSPRCEILSLQ